MCSVVSLFGPRRKTRHPAISFCVSQTVSFSTRTSMPSSSACRVKIKKLGRAVAELKFFPGFHGVF
jgi:hypothetical protein